MSVVGTTVSPPTLDSDGEITVAGAMKAASQQILEDSPGISW